MAGVDSGAVQSRGRGRARGRARTLHVESESRPVVPNFLKERENQSSAGNAEAMWQEAAVSVVSDVGHAQDVAWCASSSAAAIRINDFTKHSSSQARPDQPVLKHTQKEHRSRHDGSRFDNFITSRINQYLGQNLSRSAFPSENAGCRAATENAIYKCGIKELSSSTIDPSSDRKVVTASQSPIRSNPQHSSHRCSPGLKLKMPSRREAEISEKFKDVKVDGREFTSETRQRPCSMTLPPSSAGHRQSQERRGKDGMGALPQLSPPSEPCFKGAHDTRAVSVVGGRGRGRARGRGQGSNPEAAPHAGKNLVGDVKCHNVMEEQFQDAEPAGSGGVLKNTSRGNKILPSSRLHQIPAQTQRSSDAQTSREKNKKKIVTAASEVINSDGKSQVNAIDSVSRISEDISENSSEKVHSLDTNTDVLSPRLMSTPPGHVKVLDWAAEMATPVSPKPLPEWPAGPESVQSPDALKTPPGHVKVLDWAAEMASPVSPSPCPNWGF